MRIVRDTITYSADHLPRYNPINISGYHISEAGSSAVQEAAFTMAVTRAYVQEVTAAGIDVDAFAPRLSFFFVAQADFFEEIAKFRALRRVYAKIMRDEFGATKAESMRLRFHTQTAAATLTKPQPSNNIIRTALQALSAVLGGTQSLHTNGLDEAYAIPSEFAMKLALRTQQIIAEETRVTSTIDPLGGSWYVEALTTRMEKEIFAILEKVDQMGGVLAAIEQSYFQREIADFAYDIAKRKASGELPVIGVNMNVDEGEDEKIEVHKIDPVTEERKIQMLRDVKAARDEDAAQAALAALTEAAKDSSVNLMYPTIDAVKAKCTMGEMVNALEQVFGRYVETPVF
jgi:methylmalonyl-CoA mutase N-terminal domain/subunit